MLKEYTQFLFEIKNTYIKVSNRFPFIREVLYISEKFISLFFKNYKPENEWGFCSQCGKFSRFKYVELVDKGSYIAQSCQWDNQFIRVINVTNSLSCSFCEAKFRVRCAAQSLLENSNTSCKSIKELYLTCKKGVKHLDILETASIGGIFSRYNDWNGLVKTEFFDDVDRGKYKNNIRSENLLRLTFGDETFDIVVALDVLEHISEPWNAISEINRVLKTNGIAVITIPIDLRNQHTRQLAKEKHGKIYYLTLPAYHSDPLRNQGSLVFTDFGTDVVNILREKRYKAYAKEYKSLREKISQFVILIEKSQI
jgi:SAM-dependent methyltransferase